MRLYEIESIPGKEYNPKAGEFQLWPEDVYHYKQTMKSLPGGSGLTYVTHSRDYNRSIVILDPKNLNYYVGELKLEMANTIPEKTWQASLISVHPKYRGQGIAKALYGLALLPKPEGLGLTLVSDSIQTPGGIRNWVSLSQISGVEVTGLVAVRKVDLEKLAQSPTVQDNYEKIMVDLLGEVGGFYHSENNQFYFYQIPVKVVGSNLENTIKKSLIKIYPKDFIMGYHTLLMAQYDKSLNESDTTKADNEWFSNSKVVDSKGKPLLVFHGGANVKTLRPNTFFTPNKKAAIQYADERGDDSVVTSAYLSIKNPANEDIIERVAAELGLPDEDDAWAHISHKYLDKRHLKVISKLKEMGYDGAHFITDYAFGVTEIESWVPFNSNQIKIVR